MEIRDGKVYIDGKEYVTPGGIKGAEGQLQIELGEEEVFLLCDNREENTDSRNEVLGLLT